ncbi:uncharacterized protein LOC116344981 [Contarinia nasturtii]|uniref:uncharacterized protein LOC116344981 n=1 Tax=Contarinia nasturtii TaxID=265458 RepID=UPI0012D47DC7|nr:uncharacterized protein LOC116344981 [Contarinia nasturtii]
MEVDPAVRMDVDPDEMEIEHEEEQVTMYKAKKSTHKAMAMHVVWPRFLKQRKQAESGENETALIELMIDVIDHFEAQNILPANMAKMVNSLYAIKTSMSPEVISRELSQMQFGDMKSMYIEGQNCCLFVYMPPPSIGERKFEKKKLIVSTFPVNLSAEKIAEYSSSDIKTDFPSQSLKVEYSQLFSSLEFAQQLVYLHENPVVKTEEFHNDKGKLETRNIYVRNYVSNWLIPMLGNRNSSMATADEFAVISKKLRDDVLGVKSDVNLPFRRSAYWTVTKVSLQLAMTVEYGKDCGRLLYKIIMLKYLTELCFFYTTDMYKKLKTDVAAQLIAKMAIRLEKIQVLYNDMDANPKESIKQFMTEHKETYDRIVLSTKMMIKTVRKRIDCEIQELQQKVEIRSSLTALENLDFQSDTKQLVPKLRDYLVERQQPNQETQNRDILQRKTWIRHDGNDRTFDESSFDKLKGHTAIGLYLCDFENWVLYKLSDQKTAEELRSLSTMYHAKAVQHYKGDALGYSRMLLTQLKIVMIMDEIVTSEYKLYKKYESSVNEEIFNRLLLPLHDEIEIAHEIQSYFRKRNYEKNGIRKRPGIMEEEPSQMSFACQFAMNDDEIGQTLQKIKENEDQELQILRNEYNKAKKKMDDLKKRAEALDCEFTRTSDNGKRKHKPGCAKCELQRKIRDIRVRRYERALPDAEHNKLAVLFELQMPDEIACLRDVLCVVGSLMQKKPLTNIRIFQDWVKYEPLRKYSTSICELVFLGSKLKSALSKRGTSRATPDTPFETFSVPNGFNLSYYANQLHLPKVDNQQIDEICRFNVEESSLQWMLNGDHTQNEVIARQYECPQHITLGEYKNFGSLRADGHRLQLRKLYALIATEGLTFESQSVQALIMQILWQLGEIRSNLASDWWCCEAHEDFTDLDFVSRMTTLLDTFIDRQKSNWKHPKKLMMAAVIAVRMFELACDTLNDNNATVVEQIVELLQKLRDIAISWISKVSTAMHQCTQNQQHVAILRRNLVEIAIAGALTFYVHYEHPYFENIFEKPEAATKTPAQIWLDLLITLNSNILLDETNQTASSLRMFLSLVHRIGINLENEIQKQIKKDEQKLFALIKKHWIKSKEATQFQLLPSKNQLICVEIKFGRNNVNYVQIDVITGDFLVNNLPVARLPTEITDNELYKRVFNQFIFEVQQENSESFSTKHSSNDCYYNFQIVRKAVVVTELHKDGRRFELIPHQVLQNEIPHLLIENFSHWWSQEGNCIQFRPQQFTDEHFSSIDGVQYCLNLNDASLKSAKTKQTFLDVSSQSYVQISQRLERLEAKKFIHIFIEEANVKVAMAKLMRMNLKFVVKPCEESETNEFIILSNEYNNMRVSKKQNCGTLYGLHHGLLLESTEDLQNQSKMMIMPHGSVVASFSKHHEIVKIETENELRSPPFHTYVVDEFVQQLKAKNSSFSAWFYLAHLHALTSHGQVEPFLGISGSERALQILQSAFVWSSAPYDPESLKTLKDIEALAPVRQLKNCYQSVGWPKTIPSHAAQDSYALIIRKLIDDSNRLKDLHESPKKDTSDKEKEKPKPKPKEKEVPIDELRENKRDYFRCLPLHPNLRISDTFIDHDAYDRMIGPRCVYEERVPNVALRKIAVHYHENTIEARIRLDLFEALIENRDHLMGIQYTLEVDEILSAFEKRDVADLWISLYEFARDERFNREKFALILGLLHSHGGAIAAPIFALQIVANNPATFRQIVAPDATEYRHLEKPAFDIEVIAKIVRKSHVDPESLNKDHNHGVAIRFWEYARQIATLVETQWQQQPCDEVGPYIVNYARGDVDIADMVRKINRKLRNWNNIQKLRLFIERVEHAVNQLSAAAPQVTLTEWRNEEIEHKPEPRSKHQFHIDYEQKMCENVNKFVNDVNLAKHIFCRLETQAMPPLNRTAAEWWNVLKSIVTSTGTDHLVDAGLYPHWIPSLVLPRLLYNSNKKPTDENIRNIIGALAVTMSHEQRAKRVRMYEQQPQMKAALDRELENEPQINWCPIQYPEWLLFEIEQNLTIRPIQIVIAKRMIDPEKSSDDTKHSVMQLNMGEGKTAVIVPIVASRLANNKHACQVTVLKSLFATNLKSLRQCLGGLLNHRVYTFICRRDLPVNDHVKQMLEIYKECKIEKGVILTLPEYRLSFQLKTYESSCKGDLENAQHFLEAHKWLNANIRNILDESDAILQPKYQLIYTVGNQLSLDGGSLRWTICQAVLKRVRELIPELHKIYGNEKIEFDHNYVPNAKISGFTQLVRRFDVFTPCRLFAEDVYDRLKSQLIEEFIHSKLKDIPFTETNERAKEILGVLMNERDISVEKFNEIIAGFSDNETNAIMILSGLLRFDVLKLILTKRWRVNYGVNPKSARKMAIPYKAKDVAAEMTEFGHPDVAICLTHLSYYYSGLTDEQMYEVFRVLDNQQNAKDIYESWVKKVPEPLLGIDPTIKFYSGINLSDPKQRSVVFPLFRFSMYVIDFWLSHMVFPREAKTFEKKLMSTAWDLVSDRFTHTTTGFSGTNDTKRILPLPIVQNDLPELIETNDRVRDVLLQQSYKSLTANISGRDILNQLTDEDIPVLLDAGAMMLELNNQEVATEWLKMVAEDEYDAALYFDTNDLLMTIDRNGIITEFDNSVYRDKLNKCIVYLDDVHTRGTDLKFPIVWRAAVTLSGDITRDKTVQACMRMRLLGRGHTISFWASNEADVRIKEICNIQNHTPTTNDVIQFICHNSKKFEEDNTYHWAAAAYNYAKKIAAHENNENSIAVEGEVSPLIRLYNQCVDNEYVTLKEMYGGKEDKLLTQLTNGRFEKLKQTLTENQQNTQSLESIAAKVEYKLSQQAAHLKRFSQALDEEQEKELEHELEEQRHVQRPSAAKPMKPIFEEDLLQKLILYGASHACFGELTAKGHIQCLPMVFYDTQFYAAYAPHDNRAWASHMYATRDFKQVVEKGVGDEFLRPVLWVAKIKRRIDNDIILLLSSFEVENLLKDFKRSKKACLFMYQAKLSQFQETLIDDEHLVVGSMEPKEMLSIDEKAQLAVFSGSLYFNTEEEQSAYCGFLGLIPRQRSVEHQMAFNNNQIQPDGFVEHIYRQLPALRDAVGNAKFKKNPIQLAKSIIESRHQSMAKESHVASILEKAWKNKIEPDNNNVIE